MTDTRELAMDAIVSALTRVAPDRLENLDADTDLVGAGILDSLDTMTFLFELERTLSIKLDAIDETFDDYRPTTLAGIVAAKLAPEGIGEV